MATASKTSPSKKAPAARRKAAPRKTPAKAAAKPAKSSAPVEDQGTVDLKKKELLDAVTTATGIKRADVKQALEATLAVIGREVAAGRSVQTPELGRLKVIKQKDTPGGPVAVCRFRGPKARPSGSSEEV